jgi:type I restriction enzyme, S subunit
MFEALKPYLDYRDTRVPWLGPIPAHWNTPRLGNVLRERRETNGNGIITDVLSVMKERGVIPYAEKGNVGNKKSDDITRYKIVRPDDIVVNCMNVIIGSVGLSRYTGCLSPVYYVLMRQSSGDNPAYLNAYFQTKPFQRSLVRIGRGILAHRMRVPMDLLKCEPFPIPPPAEQAAIVRFVSAVDRRVNQLLRAKRRLIELLVEQKQAIITDAVTRGMDAGTRKRASGVDWLGDVPSHWEVVRAKYLMSIVDRRSSSGSEVLLSMRKYHGLVPYHEHFSKPPQAATLVGFKIVEPGHVVVNRMQAGFGLIFTARCQGLVSPDFGVFESNGRVIPEYLGEFLRSHRVRAKLHTESKGLGTGKTGFMRLYDDKLGTVHLTFPPDVGEQRLILERVAEGSKEIEQSIEVAEREISLIREYRTRMMFDVVTGKLDVRAIAQLLPDDDIADHAESLVDGAEDDLDADDADETSGEEVTVGED